MRTILKAENLVKTYRVGKVDDPLGRNSLAGTIGLGLFPTFGPAVESRPDASSALPTNAAKTPSNGLVPQVTS